MLVKIKDREVLVWNSDRNYSELGQRIAAIVVYPNWVKRQYLVFLDYDRQVSGVSLNCPFTKENVMAVYDMNAYQQVYSPAEMSAVGFLQDFRGEILNKLE